jgi:lipoprotein-anchoring transpeptidase ErfK/SrfK
VESGITSGRRRRPLALLLVSLALVAVTSTGAASSTGGAAAEKPTQEIVALLLPHEARSQPAARSNPLGLVPATTPITGERTVLPVLARDGQWLKVRLPGRPNGHTGWISRVGTARSVTDWHIVVELSRRQVTVYRAGRSVRVFKAIVGKPSTPTPTGQFFVEETIALRATDVGAPFALALSARSNVLQEFDGGPGQVALHGLTNIGGTLGTAASHGCIRLSNEATRWLVARIGPGVPITITGHVRR